MADQIVLLRLLLYAQWNYTKALYMTHSLVWNVVHVKTGTKNFVSSADQTGLYGLYIHPHVCLMPGDISWFTT